MFLLAVLVLPFAGSFIAALLRVNARNAEAWLAGAVALTAFCLIGAAYPNVTNGGVVGWRTDWVAELGLAFVLRLDGFAWAFAMLITGIGFLVVLYARYYMSPSDPVPRFFSLLLAFMGAMLGIVLSGNLLQLVFFWELTSLFSFLLISYWHHNAAARDGARMALVITSTGGLCLFAGVLLIGHKRDPFARALCPRTRSDPSRRSHKKRPVPVSFLAAARDGRSNSRFSLSPFGNNGEGRSVPSSAALAGNGWNE
jgi:multicomponent K+:H+ antiporter subunit A